MLTTRAVWILDCSVFVSCLEEYIEEHQTVYPWLGSGYQIDKSWNWRNFEQGLKTQKDELIDWIIRELLAECRFMHVHLHMRNSLFEMIYSKICDKHDIESCMNQYLPIPIVYPEQPVTYTVTRSCGTLFVQFETEPLYKRASPRY